MAGTECSECGGEMPYKDWSCPHCGSPREPNEGAKTEKAISTRGMMLVLFLFVMFPIVLFLIHIFVPGM